MKSTLLNMTAVLFGITLAASAGVGVVNMITEEPIAAAKEALVKIGKSGDELDKIMARFAEEWVPGSETRWRVADGLIKAGVKDDDAWYIAKKYVVGSTMGDRIAGLLSEAGLPDAATLSLIHI